MQEVRDLEGWIKALTSGNESTTRRTFCLQAKCQLGSRASRQDPEATSPASEEISSVYKLSTLRAFPAQKLFSADAPTKLHPINSSSCVVVLSWPSWMSATSSKDVPANPSRCTDWAS